MPSGISLELIIIESNRINACIVNCLISFRFLRGVIKKHDSILRESQQRDSSVRGESNLYISLALRRGDFIRMRITEEKCAVER